MRIHTNSEKFWTPRHFQRGCKARGIFLNWGVRAGKSVRVSALRFIGVLKWCNVISEGFSFCKRREKQISTTEYQLARSQESELLKCRKQEISDRQSTKFEISIETRTKYMSTPKNHWCRTALVLLSVCDLWKASVVVIMSLSTHDLDWVIIGWCAHGSIPHEPRDLVLLYSVRFDLLSSGYRRNSLHYFVIKATLNYIFLSVGMMNSPHLQFFPSTKSTWTVRKEVEALLRALYFYISKMILIVS